MMLETNDQMAVHFRHLFYGYSTLYVNHALIALIASGSHKRSFLKLYCI